MLPDIQKSEPKIQRPIKMVGVNDVNVSFLLQKRDLSFIEVISNVSMFSSLNEKEKGISMSRFIRTLIPFLHQPLKQFRIKELLNNLKNNLQQEKVFILFKFKIPRTRKSILSDNNFPVFHDCIFSASLENNEFSFFQGVKVQYASYCPCSAELCNYLNEKGSKGFPHAQRAYGFLICQTGENKIVWLEDLIDCIEDSVINLPYPIIKREDEQMIAKLAAENPMFVEDCIRSISEKIEKKEGIMDWYIEVIHEENIHQSNAVAIDFKDNSKIYFYRKFME